MPRHGDPEPLRVQGKPCTILGTGLARRPRDKEVFYEKE
jgi:hypothetical protein